MVFYTEVILANGFVLNNDLLCILSSPRSEKEGDDDGNGQFKFREKFFFSARWHFRPSMAFWFHASESVGIVVLCSK